MASFYRLLLEYETPSEWNIGVVLNTPAHAGARTPSGSMVAAVLREVADQVEEFDLSAAVEYDGTLGGAIHLAMVESEAVGSECVRFLDAQTLAKVAQLAREHAAKEGS